MNSNKKNNKVEEPAEIYEVTPKKVADNDDLHPVLAQLLEKAKREIREGKGIPHEEAMKRIKLKFPFLK